MGQVLAEAGSVDRSSEADLAAAFLVADTDGSGTINVFEFIRLFQVLWAF